MVRGGVKAAPVSQGEDENIKPSPRNTLLVLLQRSCQRVKIPGPACEARSTWHGSQSCQWEELVALLGHLLTSLLPGDKTLEVPRGGRGHPAKRWGQLLPLGPYPAPSPRDGGISRAPPRRCQGGAERCQLPPAEPRGLFLALAGDLGAKQPAPRKLI